MSAVAWILGAAAYALAGLVCARLIAGYLAYTFAASAERSYPHTHCGNTGNPWPGQWFGAWCLGVLAGIVWPLLIPLVYFPLRFPERWTIGEERRQIQRRQAERIAELERELDLR